jgi:hypothetical protein
VYSDSSEPQPESPAISPAARRIVINQEIFKSSLHLDMQVHQIIIIVKVYGRRRKEIRRAGQ